MKLHIGTGGVPLTSKDRSTVGGIKRIKELGLELMELEFVQGVRMGEEMAAKVLAAKTKADIKLTVHGPYFINLASEKNTTFYGSIKFITDSVYIGGLAGASSVTFHPAFYGQLKPQEAFELVSKGMRKIYEEFEKDKWLNHPVKKGEIKVAPELTGKPSQFGDLEEQVALCKEFTRQDLHFCFDFAHKFARSNGNFNTYDDFMKMLEYISKNLGQEFLEQMHMHVSSIQYSEKGERNHLTMLASIEEYEDEGVKVAGADKIMEGITKAGKNGVSLFNWRDLLKALKKAPPVVILFAKALHWS
jgi:deoxyribonuclease-4